MANFDAHLAGQLNQLDEDQAASVADSNAENYAAMCSETARLATMVAELQYCRDGQMLDKAGEIAEIAKLIASYAEAIQ